MSFMKFESKITMFQITAAVPMICNDSCSGRDAMVGERGERRYRKYLNIFEGERRSIKCLNIQHQIDVVS